MLWCEGCDWEGEVEDFVVIWEFCALSSHGYSAIFMGDRGGEVGGRYRRALLAILNAIAWLMGCI